MRATALPTSQKPRNTEKLQEEKTKAADEQELAPLIASSTCENDNIPRLNALHKRQTILLLLLLWLLDVRLLSIVFRPVSNERAMACFHITAV